MKLQARSRQQLVHVALADADGIGDIGNGKARLAEPPVEWRVSAPAWLRRQDFRIAAAPARLCRDRLTATKLNQRAEQPHALLLGHAQCAVAQRARGLDDEVADKGIIEDARRGTSKPAGSRSRKASAGTQNEETCSRGPRSCRRVNCRSLSKIPTCPGDRLTSRSSCWMRQRPASFGIEIEAAAIGCRDVGGRNGGPCAPES